MTSVDTTSDYSKKNAERRLLAKRCIDDPQDMVSLEKLFKLVHPLAIYVMNEHKQRIPTLGIDDYLQIADITVWRVIRRIRVKPDLLESFEPYVIAAIRNSYITEYRNYVFKSVLAVRSYNRPGSPLTVSYVFSMEEYVQQIITKRNNYRRAFRASHLELCRRREKDYWTKNKDKKRAKDRRYYQKHKRELAEKAKIYRASHKEQRNAHDRQYRAEHPEETRGKRRAYYWKTVDHQREYRNAYNAAHKESRRAQCKRYYEKNREEILAKGREYKRKKRAEAKLIQKSKESVEITIDLGG